MKKIFLLSSATIIGLLFFQATSKPETKPETTSQEMQAPNMPADVKAIVEQKCYGCHNVNSKNEKGKAKLDWDAFETTKKSKQLAAKGKINKVLEKGDMPPKKFLLNKPEGNLTEAELATLMDWSAGKKKSSK